jgi:tRNA(fMet)-specific endonuclease VapC
MSRYLVDTDWIINALRGQRQANETLVALAPEGLAVSYISYAELVQGAYYAEDSARAIHILEAFLEGKELLPLSLEIMQRFGILRGQLQQQGTPIGELDLFIGATALEHDLIVLTRNRRHFERIPGVELYPESS